jgi:hypothetical protein
VIVQENYIKKATLYTPLLIVREIFIHQLESMKMIINVLSNETELITQLVSLSLVPYFNK